jgi:hypothetical protein
MLDGRRVDAAVTTCGSAPTRRRMQLEQSPEPFAMDDAFAECDQYSLALIQAKELLADLEENGVAALNPRPLPYPPEKAEETLRATIEQTRREIADYRCLLMDCANRYLEKRDGEAAIGVGFDSDRWRNHESPHRPACRVHVALRSSDHGSIPGYTDRGDLRRTRRLR